MGQKTNPIGNRLGIIKTWDSKWFTKKDYLSHLHEDLSIRKFIKKSLFHAGVAKIGIERAGQN
ncbi:MAG: 30S ribosomal protein S3, partial [Thermodesulfovibrionia bacterium]|nr:30S ribosomal protein S3 [Thermodesulfovibrionia bacterium]